ncbi:MAG: hypothetical protein ACE5JB_13810 [bacterium]
MINYFFKYLNIPELILLFYSILTFIGCSKDKNQSQQNIYNESAPHFTSSKMAKISELNRNNLNKPELFRGIVYVSNADSISHLALESENGIVYLIIGDKQWELSNLQNRKVEVWGYLHENILSRGNRDSVEVIRYKVIHGEGD